MLPISVMPAPENRTDASICELTGNEIRGGGVCVWEGEGATFFINWAQTKITFYQLHPNEVPLRENLWASVGFRALSFLQCQSRCETESSWLHDVVPVFITGSEQIQKVKHRIWKNQLIVPEHLLCLVCMWIHKHCFLWRMIYRPASIHSALFRFDGYLMSGACPLHGSQCLHHHAHASFYPMQSTPFRYCMHFIAF